MENNFYIVMFVNEKDEYLAIETYGGNKQRLKDVAISKVKRIYGNKFEYHSIRKLIKKTDFIYF